MVPECPTGRCRKGARCADCLGLLEENDSFVSELYDFLKEIEAELPPESVDSPDD